MITSILHLLLAVFLFYLVNWIGKHSSDYGYLQLSLFVRSDQAPAFNFILKALTPAVFIILVATASYALHFDGFVRGIWLVAVYYFGFRLLYNLILGRALLLNWVSFLAQSIVGIAAAYLAYRHLILPRRPMLPDAASIGNQLWVVVALFLYATFNSVRTSGEASAIRKNRYLRSRLKSLRGRYDSLIVGQFRNRYMELVAYAILIHETFNRPWIAREVERAVFPWGSHTIGPMQVYTTTRLSDEDSVRLGVRRLAGYFDTTEKELSEKSTTQYEFIRVALAKYNRDENYVREIFDLLHILWAQIAPEYRTEFESMYHRSVPKKPNP